jgi:hypothetical protein
MKLFGFCHLHDNKRKNYKFICEEKLLIHILVEGSPERGQEKEGTVVLLKEEGTGPTTGKEPEGQREAEGLGRRDARHCQWEQNSRCHHC